jgi:hypothetical protein
MRNSANKVWIIFAHQHFALKAIGQRLEEKKDDYYTTFRKRILGYKMKKNLQNRILQQS